MVTTSKLMSTVKKSSPNLSGMCSSMTATRKKGCGSKAVQFATPPYRPSTSCRSWLPATNTMLRSVWSQIRNQNAMSRKWMHHPFKIRLQNQTNWKCQRENGSRKSQNIISGGSNTNASKSTRHRKNRLCNQISSIGSPIETQYGDVSIFLIMSFFLVIILLIHRLC